MKPGRGAQPCACLREHSTWAQVPLGGFEVRRVEVGSRASAQGLPAWSCCSSQGMGSRLAPGQGLPAHTLPDLDLIFLISTILLIGRSQGLLSQSDSLLTTPHHLCLMLGVPRHPSPFASLFLSVSALPSPPPPISLWACPSTPSFASGLTLWSPPPSGGLTGTAVKN